MRADILARSPRDCEPSLDDGSDAVLRECCADTRAGTGTGGVSESLSEASPEMEGHAGDGAHALGESASTASPPHEPSSRAMALSIALLTCANASIGQLPAAI